MRVYGGNTMTIRVGIIGRNFVVDWLLAAMEQVPELRPAAIYSRSAETGRAFAEKYHLCLLYTSGRCRPGRISGSGSCIPCRWSDGSS